MFNVREMFPKRRGLKVLRRPRLLLLGSARTSLGLLKPGVDRLFSEEYVGVFLAAWPCGPRSLYTARALSTACSPDCLSRNAAKTLSTLARARMLRPLSCAQFVLYTGDKASPILSPCAKSKEWALAFTAGCAVEEDDVELFELNMRLTCSDDPDVTRLARCGLLDRGCF